MGEWGGMGKRQRQQEFGAVLILFRLFAGSGESALSSRGVRVWWQQGAALALALLLALVLWRPASADPASADNDSAFVLWMPYVSQLTDSPYAGSNCGPASVTMVLNAYGDFATLDQVRDEANELQGIYAYDAGVPIEILAAIVQRHGLVAIGPYGGDGLKRWTPEEVREQLRQGRAFIPQMHYASLPGHEDGNPYIDHYVVIYGLLGDGFIYADADFPQHTLEGGYRFLSAERLQEAWGSSSFPFAGFAIAPGEGYHSLLPTPTRTPTNAPAPTDTPRPTRTPLPSFTPTATSTPTPTPSPVATARPAETLPVEPKPTESRGLFDLLSALAAATGAALGLALK